MRPFFPALGTLALLGVLLAGCGDDGGSGSGDAAAPASSEDGGSASAVAFCARAEGLEERLAGLDSSGGPTPELFEEVSDAFGELAADAPDEIRADLETLAAALAALAEVFEEVDPEDPESLAVLEEEAARLEEEGKRLEEAGSNVEAYLREECGIDFQEGSSGAGPGGAGADDGTAGEQPAEELDGQG